MTNVMCEVTQVFVSHTAPQSSLWLLQADSWPLRVTQRTTTPTLSSPLSLTDWAHSPVALTCTLTQVHTTGCSVQASHSWITWNKEDFLVCEWAGFYAESKLYNQKNETKRQHFSCKPKVIRRYRSYNTVTYTEIELLICAIIWGELNSNKLVSPYFSLKPNQILTPSWTHIKHTTNTHTTFIFIAFPLQPES